MLTPLEIENKEFKNAMFGYDKTDVEDFMNLVLADYENLYKESISNRDKLSMLNDTISQYKTMEDTLKDTLLVAQNASEELKKSAEEKSNNIIKEAEIKANEIVKGADDRVREINLKFDCIKRDIEMYNTKLKILISSQSNIINEFMSDIETEE